MTTKPPFPAALSEFSPPDIPEDDAESGTIAYITARLSRWARIAPPGMALATFESSLARKAVIKGMTDALTPDGIPVNHVALGRELPAIDHVRRLMNDVLPGASGIIHVTGFQYAFTAEETVTEALRLLNYNRENLVNFPVQQIWWMTPDFAATFENTVPELARYFLISVRLTETIRPATDTMTFEMLPEGQRLSAQEARQLSRINRERFETAIKQPLTITEAVRLACEVFEPLLQAGLVAEASTLWKQASDKIEAVGLPVREYANAKHDAVAITASDALNISNLADLFCSQGLYDRAEMLYAQALMTREQIFGLTHHDTATSLNNLAELYRLQGLYHKAEPLYIRALAIHEQFLGAMHLDTAKNLNNLALLYKLQGLYSKSEPLYVRALAITEQVLGTTYSNTAISLNNLASLYESQGLYDKAEVLYTRALAIHEQVLGATHPDTAKIINNLGLLRYNQRRWQEANELLERAFDIQLKTLGLKHPDTQLTINNLTTLKKQNAIMNASNQLTIKMLPVIKTIKTKKSRGKKSR